MNKSVDSMEIVNVDEVKNIHTLLEESITHIASQWVEQLKIVRENTITLENQILACVTKTKSDITMLHSLGTQVAEEARRGQEVCRQLSDSIEKIATS